MLPVEKRYLVLLTEPTSVEVRHAAPLVARATGLSQFDVARTIASGEGILLRGLTELQCVRALRELRAFGLPVAALAMEDVPTLPRKPALCREVRHTEETLALVEPPNTVHTVPIESCAIMTVCKVLEGAEDETLDHVAGGSSRAIRTKPSRATGGHGRKLAERKPTAVLIDMVTGDARRFRLDALTLDFRSVLPQIAPTAAENVKRLVASLRDRLPNVIQNIGTRPEAPSLYPWEPFGSQDAVQLYIEWLWAHRALAAKGSAH